MKSLVILCCLAAIGLTASAADKKPTKPITVTGTLKTGVVAIGGETTGIVVTTKDTSYELDLGKDKKLQELATKLNGKQVSVTGMLDVRPGVEVKERRIITVSKLEEAKK